jgi:hypothetical protein
LQGEKLRICGGRSAKIGSSNPKSANPNNIGSANHKSASCHTYGRSAIITILLSPQICGFAICGTYLRTAHLCYMHNILCKKSANYCFQFRTERGGRPHIILVPINKTNKRGVHIVRLKYGYAAHMCVHDLGSFPPQFTDPGHGHQNAICITTPNTVYSRFQFT